MKKHLSSAPSIRVRRRRGHAPSERKTAIAAILVICAVIIAVSAALCCKAGLPACSAQRTPPPQNTFVPTSDSLSTATPEPTTAAPLPTATPAPYTFVSVSVSDAAEGQLALVNFEHGFPAADSTDVVPVTAAGSLLTERNDLSLAQPALSALSALAEAFSEQTGGDRLLLTSAYRTLEYQQGVYDDYVAAYGQAAADAYVAAPGTSEHHTGLAADLSSMSKDGERVTLPNHPQFEWLKAHCADYGFILRYPPEKENITHVAYEPWHFRYIGKENAAAVRALGITFEEYIEYLRGFTPETKLLHVPSLSAAKPEDLGSAEFSALPDSGYVIYFVPTDENAGTESVNIPVPAQCRGYFISGSNDGGFIVTAEL